MVIVVGVMLSSAIRGGAGAGGAKKTQPSVSDKRSLNHAKMTNILIIILSAFKLALLTSFNVKYSFDI